MQRFDGLIRHYREYGFFSTISFIFWIIKAKIIHAKNFQEDYSRILSLKNKYKDDRIFLIGNGPSLNITPLYLLENENTICFNRFSIMLERINWTPTFYMIIDGLVAKEMMDEINYMIGIAEKSFIPDIIPKYKINFRKRLDKNRTIFWIYPQSSPEPHNNIPYLFLGGSVATAALRLLMYMGFKEIFLIGVDMNYKIHENVTKLSDYDIVSNNDDDPNHFDPRYFGTKRKYHQPTKSVVDNIFNSFNTISEFASKKGFKIYNATIGGKLESFERVDFETLFKYSKTEKYELFRKSVFRKTKVHLPDTYFDFEKLDHVSTIREINPMNDYFIIKKDKTNFFIQNTINEYLPYGPYNGKLVFIKKEIVQSS